MASGKNIRFLGEEENDYDRCTHGHPKHKAGSEQLQENPHRTCPGFPRKTQTRHLRAAQPEVTRIFTMAVRLQF